MRCSKMIVTLPAVMPEWKTADGQVSLYLTLCLGLKSSINRFATGAALRSLTRLLAVTYSPRRLFVLIFDSNTLVDLYADDRRAG